MIFYPSGKFFTLIYSKRILFFRLYSNIKLGINETNISTNTLNITDKKLSGEK